MRICDSKRLQMARSKSSEKPPLNRVRQTLDLTGHSSSIDSVDAQLLKLINERHALRNRWASPTH